MIFVKILLVVILFIGNIFVYEIVYLEFCESILWIIVIVIVF